MAIGKIKFFVLAKIIFILFYISYAIAVNIKIFPTLEDYANLELEAKKPLLGNVCLSLTGGSNVIWGISAGGVSSQFCYSRNYGVTKEGKIFENYLKWLSGTLKSKRVLYSSIYFWTEENEISENDWIPKNSIMSVINRYVLPDQEGFGVNEFDVNGDLIKYRCPKFLKPFEMNLKFFEGYNDLAVIEIKRRLILMSNLSSSGEIFIRIPPQYVSEKNVSAYKAAMDKRIGLLKKNGLKVLDTTILSSDKSLFCDNPHHPNYKGREFFTSELKLILIDL